MLATGLQPGSWRRRVYLRLRNALALFVDRGDVVLEDGGGIENELYGRWLCDVSQMVVVL